METPEQRSSANGTVTLNKLYRYVRNLDNASKDQYRRLNILLVLSCGNLAMLLIILIALFIQ